MSSSNCCFLTCIQVSQEAGQVVWYSHLLQNFPQFIVIQTVKGFGIVNKAEIDVFLEFSCFFDDPADVGNLISGSSVFSKPSLNICKFTFNVLLKPGLENFEHYFTSVWDECNCAVVGTFFWLHPPPLRAMPWGSWWGSSRLWIFHRTCSQTNPWEPECWEGATWKRQSLKPFVAMLRRPLTQGHSASHFATANRKPARLPGWPFRSPQSSE